MAAVINAAIQRKSPVSPALPVTPNSIQSASSSLFALRDARQRWLGLCQVYEYASSLPVAVRADLGRH